MIRTRGTPDGGAHDGGTRRRRSAEPAGCRKPCVRGGFVLPLLLIAGAVLAAGCERPDARPDGPAAASPGAAAAAGPAGEPLTGDGAGGGPGEQTTTGGAATPGPAAPVAPDARPDVGIQTHVLWGDQDDAERLKTLDLIAASNVGWVRMDLGWCSIEERPGQLSGWKLDRADHMVDAAREHGLQVLMTLWCTPEWASEDGAINSPPGDPADYARVAGVLARHFRGRVAAWEVWNEPNASEFWEGADPSRYAELLRAAYPELKAQDPQATVVFGGVSYNDTAWIDRAYAAGAAGAFDALGVHPYMGIADRPPETPYNGDFRTFRGVEAVRSVMLEHGDDAPIWFTEFGWSVNANREDAAGWTRGVTPEQQADYLVRAIELVERAYPYVSHMFWYNDRATGTTDDRLAGYGLLTRDFELRPAYHALQRHLATR